MIRRAMFTDVPALRRLFAHLVAELEAARRVPYPQYTADDLDAFTLLLAQRLEQDPTLLAYVALDDETGDLTGFLAGELTQRRVGQPAVFGAAHWLYISPDARGQGVARALVRAGCADLAALGVTHVELASVAGDEQWAARGWQPYLTHYVLPLDAVVAAAAERPEPPAAEPPPAAVGAENGAPAAPAPQRPPPRRRRRRRSVRPAGPPGPGAEPCA
jgi:ribosomal protein S18 acetylase RimI-like enzyme